MADTLVPTDYEPGAIELQAAIHAVMRGEAVVDARALDIVRGAAEWAGASEQAFVLIAQSTRASLDPDHDGATCPYFEAPDEDFDCWVCRADLAVEHVRGYHQGDSAGLYECYACAFGDDESASDEPTATDTGPAELAAAPMAAR